MRHLLLMLFLLMGMHAHAEMTIETIELHHRTADDVISILQPMVTSGGSISGTGYKLFIKSTPDNIEQLRKMVSEIDVGAQQLLISVSMDREVLNQTRQGSARVTVNDGKQRITVGEQPSGPGSADVHLQTDKGKIKYDARLFERAHTERRPQAQQMRVSEGLWATIRTGQAVPIVTRSRNSDGTVTEYMTYQEVTSGFQVLPRVNGNNVILTIRPQAQTPDPAGGGAYLTLEMESTVTGQLGKWLTLGNVDESQRDTATGLTIRTEHRGNESRQIFVKVERIQ